MFSVRIRTWLVQFCDLATYPPAKFGDDGTRAIPRSCNFAKVHVGLCHLATAVGLQQKL